MGCGDNLMATGMARGAHARGKRIAFGDGEKIIWDHNSEAIFRGNPNIAKPGSEKDADIEWIAFHRGHRVYNEHDRDGNKWIWNLGFRPTPGEVFFSADEQRFAGGLDAGLVVIEPNVPAFKSVAPNKQWPVDRYQAVANRLRSKGRNVAQLVYGGAHTLSSVRRIKTKDFRHALAALSRSALYIGAEGGLHHGAAAVGIPAVVLFGGFIPPEVTGYDTHINLTGGAAACGSIGPCEHCKAAMAAISVEQVYGSAMKHLEGNGC